MWNDEMGQVQQGNFLNEQKENRSEEELLQSARAGETASIE